MLKEEDFLHWKKQRVSYERDIKMRELLKRVLPDLLHSQYAIDYAVEMHNKLIKDIQDALAKPVELTPQQKKYCADYNLPAWIWDYRFDSSFCLDIKFDNIPCWFIDGDGDKFIGLLGQIDLFREARFYCSQTNCSYIDAYPLETPTQQKPLSAELETDTGELMLSKDILEI